MDSHDYTHPTKVIEKLRKHDFFEIRELSIRVTYRFQIVLEYEYMLRKNYCGGLKS